MRLYKDREGGREKVGTGSDSGKIAIEFQLSGIKAILDLGEEYAKASRGRYGILVDNPQLRIARALGNPENVLGTYLKKYAWGNDPYIKSLKGVNLVKTVVKLMTGEETGFPCVEVGSGANYTADGLFRECKKDAGWDKDKFKVKFVLKSVAPGLAGRKVPVKGKGGAWHLQADAKENGSKIYNDDFNLSKVINEKCEPDNGVSGFTDQELKINIGVLFLFLGFLSFLKLEII